MKYKRIATYFVLAIMSSLIMQTLVFATENNSFNNFKKVNAHGVDFEDVETTDWFYDNLKAVYELGLMVGRSEEYFAPGDNMTVAEAMTIAARLNSIYKTGKNEFAKSEPWYKTYTDYCKENGIADIANYEPNALITRGQFADIFANALPEEALLIINEIENGAIPDVKENDTFAKAIYALYRAGILIGNDAEGTFAPDSNIRRSEITAITGRMAVPSQRQKVTLKVESTEYEVSFDLAYDGKTLSSKKVKAGEAVTEPKSPSRSGYRFFGWYTQKTGGKKFDFDDAITTDITLYAHWDKISSGSSSPKYNVTFDVQGIGTAPQSLTSVKSKSKISAPEVPSGDGYTFGGWYKESSCENEWIFAEDIVTADITLYAKWTKTIEELLPDGFPTSIVDAWKTADGNACYIDESNICLNNQTQSISLSMPLSTEALKSGDDFVIIDSENDVTIIFTMSDDELTTISCECASGDYTNIVGDYESEVVIDDYEDLITFVESWNSGEFPGAANIKLANDITIELDEDEAWTPIGTWKNPFYGTFDGNGKTISGLVANETHCNYEHVPSLNATVGEGETYGFFGIIGGGDTTIKNLTLDNVDIDIANGKNVGALIGYVPSNADFTKEGKGADYWASTETAGKKTLPANYGTDDITISNVTVSGNIAANSHVGGLVGKIYSTGVATIEECTNNAIITESGLGGIAGFIGYVNGCEKVVVKDCTNTSDSKFVLELGSASSGYMVDDFAYIMGGMVTEEGTNTSDVTIELPVSGSTFAQFIYMGKNNITLEDYTVTSIQNIGTITIKNCTVSNKLENLVRGTTSGDMTIEGDCVINGTLKNNGILSIESGEFNNTITNNGTLTVENGTFNKVITNNPDATLNIVDGNFTGINNDGILEVDNGTFNKGDYYSVINGNSQTAEMIVNSGDFEYCILNRNNSTLTIIDGTFTSGGSNSGAIYSGATVEILGGTFEDKFNIVDGTISITGGEFKINPSQYLEDGYIARLQSGYYIVEEGSWAAEFNGNKYATLQEAVSVYNDANKQIKLLKDIETSDTIGSLQAIVFDLNNHNLACAISTNGNYVNFYGTGTATLKSGTNISKVYAKDLANVVINDGVTITRSPLTSPAVQIQNGTGTITIEGGAISGAFSKGDGTIIIKGGTFTSDPSAYLDDGYGVTMQGDKYVVKPE